MTNTEINSASWSTSLETWARAHYDGRPLTVSGTMDFAPLGTLRPRTFSDLPVVLAVMTERTTRLHTALTKSLELVREATYAFRMVALTDDPTSDSLRAVDWSVEHVLGESAWRMIREDNWLPAAVDHLEWARRQFGASLVIAPETPAQVHSALLKVGVLAGAPQAIVDAAGGLADEAMEGAATAALGERDEHGQDRTPAVAERSVRGWWNATSSEGSTRRVSLTPPHQGRQVQVVLHHGSAEGVLITDEPDARHLCAAARADGWSTVEIQLPMSVLFAGTDQRRFLRALILAAADGMSVVGPSLVVTGETGSAGLDLGQADISHAVAGTVHLQDNQSAQITMDYGASALTSMDDLPRVLKQLRRIHLVTAL